MLLSMYYPMTRSHASSYIPTYHVTVKAPDVCRIYFGALREIGLPMPFPQILRKYYEGSIWALLQTMLWGGGETRDSEIIEDMGLQYSSFRVDLLSRNHNSTYGKRTNGVITDHAGSLICTRSMSKRTPRLCARSSVRSVRMCAAIQRCLGAQVIWMYNRPCFVM